MEVLDWKLHAITAHHFVQVITSQLSRTSCERVMHYARLLLNFIDSDFVTITPELNYIYQIEGHPIAKPGKRREAEC